MLYTQKRTFSTAVFCIAVFLVTAYTPVSVLSQWKQLQSFNSQIMCIHFLDQEGAPARGFVGTANGSVWRTTDYGKTWTKAVTPASLIGPVTSYTFKNPAIGWLSARQTKLTTGVYKTIDSGKTWIATPQNGEQTSVTYNPASGSLVTTSWSSNNAVSMNEGLTWQPMQITTNQNGVVYTSPMNGVMSTFGGTFASTTDGGVTWNTNPYNVEAWQPLALKNTNTVFLAAENQRQIIRSNDGGNTWNFVFQFPQFFEITGDIRGTQQLLVLQARERFMRSTDMGVTWQSYCGPGNAYDTRFYMMGDTVFGGTVDGVLYWNPYGMTRNNQLLEVSTDSMFIFAPGCIKVDSILKIINTGPCVTMELLDVGILGSPTFSLKRPTPQSQLQPSDSVLITYSPDDFLMDSAQVVISYRVDGRTFERRVKLTGNGAPVNNSQFTKELTLLLSSDCSKLDTFITIFNGPCDTLRILSAFVTDPNIFRITNLSSLPLTINAGGNTKLFLEVNTVAPGTYNAYLTISFIAGGEKRDTIIPLKLDVLSANQPQAQLSKKMLELDSVSICSFKYDTLTFTNTICKPLKLTAITMQQNNPAYTVVYQPPLTRILDPGESDRIILLYSPRSVAAETEIIRLSFEFDPQNRKDMIVPVLGFGKSVSAASLADTVLAFEPILVCEDAVLTTYLRNMTCDSMNIISIQPANDSSFVIVEPTSFPTAVSPDDSIRLRVHVVPRSSDAKFDSVTVLVRTKSGGSQLLTLKLLGTVKPKVRNLALASSFIFDTLPPCTSRDSILTIRNLGICDTITIDSFYLNGSNWFSLVGAPLLPQKLLPGEAAEFLISAEPLGGLNASAALHIFGEGFDSVVMITAATQRGGSTVTLSSPDSVLYAYECKDAHGTYTVTNSGCDTLYIDSLSLVMSGSQFSFDPMPSLPLKIAPDESLQLGIRFTPSQQGDSSATLIIGAYGGMMQTYALRGSLAGTRATTRFTLSFDDNSTVQSRFAGEFVKTRLSLNDMIQASRDLKKIVVEYRFHSNVLTVTDPRVTGGWDMQRDDSVGLLRLTLTRNNSTTVMPTPSFILVDYFVTIGDSTYSPISIRSLRFNDNDSLYEQCVLSPLGIGELLVNVHDTCGDAFIRGYIRRDPKIFDNLRLKPNPIRSGGNLITEIDLHQGSTVIISVFDVNGKQIERLTFPDRTVGRQQFMVPMSEYSEGTYLISVETDGCRLMDKILLTR